MSSFVNYKLRLAQARVNVLESIYKKPTVVAPVVKENMRLRFRFTEAIREAQEICSIDETSSECHWAWYEVDELEDALFRLDPESIF